MGQGRIVVDVDGIEQVCADLDALVDEVCAPMPWFTDVTLDDELAEEAFDFSVDWARELDATAEAMSELVDTLHAAGRTFRSTDAALGAAQALR